MYKHGFYGQSLPNLDGKLFKRRALRASAASQNGQDLPRLLTVSFFGDFRGILSRAEIEFAEEEKDSGSEVVEGAKAAHRP